MAAKGGRGRSLTLGEIEHASVRRLVSQPNAHLITTTLIEAEFDLGRSILPLGIRRVARADNGPPKAVAPNRQGPRYPSFPGRRNPRAGRDGE
jgi:hypothetical protein